MHQPGGDAICLFGVRILLHEMSLYTERPGKKKSKPSIAAAVLSTLRSEFSPFYTLYFDLEADLDDCFGLIPPQKMSNSPEGTEQPDEEILLTELVSTLHVVHRIDPHHRPPLHSSPRSRNGRGCVGIYVSATNLPA